MKITPDSNILVRAHTHVSGSARALIDIIQAEPRHQLVLSKHILDEVTRVLFDPRLRTRYRLSETEIFEYVGEIEAICTLVEPIVVEPVLTDPKDDPVLYTALDGNADVLCTLDKHFYRPHVAAFCTRNGFRIMGDIELLNLLRKKA
jgi:uncharacterized protein